MIARIFLPTLVVSLCLFTQPQAAEPPQTGSLRDGFESTLRMTTINDDGMWKIHHCGPTEEHAAEGKRSVKIDVEWLDPSWDCWRPLPLMLLYRGTPTVRAKILVERGSGQLGHPYSTKECGTAGLIVGGKQTGSRDGGWLKWEAKADGKSGDDRYLQAALLWVRPDSEGRTTVYIDDLEVEGQFSPEEVKRLADTAMRCAEEQRAEYLKEIAAVEHRFAEITKKRSAAFNGPHNIQPGRRGEMLESTFAFPKADGNGRPKLTASDAQIPHNCRTCRNPP